MKLHSAQAVSMPYIGLPPFLREGDKGIIIGKDCVNALYRASPISTCRKQWFRSSYLCQCPISGFPHFYIRAGRKKGLPNKVCQCPISGFPHFYTDSWTWGARGAVCQCPISGFPHFYIHGISPCNSLICVNALYRASPISTRDTAWRDSAWRVCQCPISGFPHFYLKR